ncbi:hypothetical protein [Sporomusa acidovorans]|uniref:Uncharacterized protein n=2 Tax=Sporomusa TaxID=2375 RepID=A0ABZ3J550_SPOA4|nr:hypothetical protein [Sporomusa acidovorans]OZC23516.1 hypothetical protein SPACI_06170 [Sporomusa acidovorans DSM 3132]SDF47602.1 hypothetical protein SAMN04488499_105131 [Sporomusa acidovorans]
MLIHGPIVVEAVMFVCKIIAETGRIKKFDVDLYFALTEKVVVHDDGRLTVGLLDGTEVECLIE